MTLTILKSKNIALLGKHLFLLLISAILFNCSDADQTNQNSEIETYLGVPLSNTFTSEYYDQCKNTITVKTYGNSITKRETTVEKDNLNNDSSECIIKINGQIKRMSITKTNSNTTKHLEIFGYPEEDYKMFLYINSEYHNISMKEKKQQYEELLSQFLIAFAPNQFISEHPNFLCNSQINENIKHKIEKHKELVSQNTKNTSQHTKSYNFSMEYSGSMDFIKGHLILDNFSGKMLDMELHIEANQVKIGKEFSKGFEFLLEKNGFLKVIGTHAGKTYKFEFQNHLSATNQIETIIINGEKHTLTSENYSILQELLAQMFPHAFNIVLH